MSNKDRLLVRMEQALTAFGELKAAHETCSEVADTAQQSIEFVQETLADFDTEMKAIRMEIRALGGDPDKPIATPLARAVELLRRSTPFIDAGMDEFGRGKHWQSGAEELASEVNTFFVELNR